MSRTLRKVLVYRPVEIGMEELKAGDVFSMIPANHEDLQCYLGLCIAKTDGKKIDDGVSTAEVTANPLIEGSFTEDGHVSG